MAKQKWYVVTKGLIPGIYWTWTATAPHVQGVPGAVHQSFNTEAEAIRAYQEARSQHQLEVIGGPSAGQSSPKPSTTSPPSPRPPARVSVETSTTTSQTSTPRSFLRHTASVPSSANTQPARSPSPTVIHANVSYTRGMSPSACTVTPRSTRAQPLTQPPTPRAVFQTPSELPSYPSDSESSASEDSFELAYENTPSPAQYRSRVSTPLRKSPSTDSASPKVAIVMTPRTTVGVEMPSTTAPLESALDPPLVLPLERKDSKPLLSPLQSIDMSTPRHAARMSPRSPTKHQADTPTRYNPILAEVQDDIKTPVSSQKPMALGTRCCHTCPYCSVPAEYRSNPAYEIVSSPQESTGPESPPPSHSFSVPEECWHLCRQCHQLTHYTSKPLTPGEMSRPNHVPVTTHESLLDPRSPMPKTAVIPGLANSISFGRPSPNLDLESRMQSALFV